jgi:hypothetical protein
MFDPQDSRASPRLSDLTIIGYLLLVPSILATVAAGLAIAWGIYWAAEALGWRVPIHVDVGVAAMPAVLVGAATFMLGSRVLGRFGFPSTKAQRLRVPADQSPMGEGEAEDMPFTAEKPPR